MPRLTAEFEAARRMGADGAPVRRIAETLGLALVPIVRHVYGAIQEYAGIDCPEWLDGPAPRAQAEAD